MFIIHECIHIYASSISLEDTKRFDGYRLLSGCQIPHVHVVITTGGEQVLAFVTARQRQAVRLRTAADVIQTLADSTYNTLTNVLNT